MSAHVKRLLLLDKILNIAGECYTSLGEWQRSNETNSLLLNTSADTLSCLSLV